MAETVTDAAPSGKPKKKRRWRRIMAALVVLWALFIGPWPVAWLEPLEGNATHAENLRRLAALANRPKSTAGPLKAGFAAVEITDIAEGAPLAGYGARAFRGNSGIDDPIYVRAIVLEGEGGKAAIVSPDLLLVNSRLRDEIVKRLKVSDPSWTADRILFGATHTHSGPGGYSGNVGEILGIGFARKKIIDGLAERAADAVIDAAARMTPVRVGAAAIEVDAIGNRTADGGPVNRWLDLVRFEPKLTGERSCFWMSYSAHATARPSEDGRVSADYPGFALKATTKTGDGLFLA
ncbi:MAG TPA: neutral/alkaline non-lysosomal ceramidase N-terminal domain-containing protein, partial [Planctomycetia bacterium]|nr:neutral/alkaline non-lysosomal ceramidase N-terminal domain-containing protein [Planctomycetia bacterium]